MSNLPGIVLTLFAERAIHLVPILLAALLVGEPLAKLLRFPQLRLTIGGLISKLNAKLNRSSRSTATRVYRGIAVLAILLLPTLALGLLLMRPVPWIELLATLLLVPLFGELLRPYQLLRVRRAARAGTLTLQSSEPSFLFPDTYALLRATILSATERVALLVGGSLAFLLADVAGLLLYFMLAAAARFYAPIHTGNRAFGWAAAALFALLDALPRFITSALCWIAACFTPRTSPFLTLHHLTSSKPHLYGWVACLLNLSLGGPVPTAAGEAVLPWQGHGTPKPDAAHLSRALQLLGLATLLWIWLLATSIYLLPTVK